MLEIDPERMTRNQLIARVDALEGQIAALQEANGPAVVLSVQKAFELTTQEAKLLLLLSDGNPRTKDQILYGIYHDRIDDPPEIKIIDVFICKTRKKVEPFGVRIDTIWGSGYRLDAGADIIAKAIAGERLTPEFASPDDRPHPPHMFKRRHGEILAAALAELTRRADARGEVQFGSREFAAKAGINRQVSSILNHLARANRIKIISRPPPGGRSRKVWKIRLVKREAAAVAA